MHKSLNPEPSDAALRRERSRARKPDLHFFSATFALNRRVEVGCYSALKCYGGWVNVQISTANLFVIIGGVLKKLKSILLFVTLNKL
jgi:hypothetical protein